jgi:hypothetical protein
MVSPPVAPVAYSMISGVQLTLFVPSVAVPVLRSIVRAALGEGPPLHTKQTSSLS